MCTWSHFTAEYFGKLNRWHRIWQNKSLVEALCELSVAVFKVTGQHLWDSPVLDSERPNWWNISLHCGSGTGLYHIVLGKASAMSPSGAERQGEYIRGRFSTLGSDIRSPWEGRDSLWLKESEWWSYNGSRNGGSVGEALLWHSYAEKDDLSLTPAGTWLTV